MPVTFDIADSIENADLTGFTRGTANFAMAGVHHSDIANSEFVSYGASSMTAVDSRVDEPGGLFSRTTATFRLASPPSGSQTIDFDDAAAGFGNALLIGTYNGVNTTTPIRTTKIVRTANGVSDGAVTFGIGESSANDLLVVFAFNFDNTTGTTYTTSVGTVRQVVSANGGSNRPVALITAPGSGSSQTVTVTFDAGTGRILLFAYSLQEAGGGGGGSMNALVNSRTRLTGLTTSRRAGGL
jgi:hypothetical protein